MSYFPDRQEAVKMLYEAAGRLLEDAAEFEMSIKRQLNQIRAANCTKLAEQIAGMRPIKIIIDDTIQRVEGIPFDLGYVIEYQDQEKIKETHET